VGHLLSKLRRQAAAPLWGIIGILPSHRRRKPIGLLWAAASCRSPVGNHRYSFFAPPPQADRLALGLIPHGTQLLHAIGLQNTFIMNDVFRLLII